MQEPTQADLGDQAYSIAHAQGNVAHSCIPMGNVKPQALDHKNLLQNKAENNRANTTCN